MRVFVLGALDPEMRAIESVLAAQGEAYVSASYKGRRVEMHTAYQAHSVQPAMPVGATDVIFVECTVMGLRYSDLIDHHRSGDPGFDMQPGEYLKGSSLGQLLTLLGLEPTDEQRIICAADHCLTYAYQGLCPGVDPVDLAHWRAGDRAARIGISVESFEARVAQAHALLEQAERINVAGTPIAWVGEINKEYGEASARHGIAFMGTRSMGSRTSVAMFGAPPEAVREWMRTCGLQDVFGAPERGYAGGYA